jgi:hypothetical protein
VHELHELSPPHYSATCVSDCPRTYGVCERRFIKPWFKVGAMTDDPSLKRNCACASVDRLCRRNRPLFYLPPVPSQYVTVTNRSVAQPYWGDTLGRRSKRCASLVDSAGWPRVLRHGAIVVWRGKAGRDLLAVFRVERHQDRRSPPLACRHNTSR